MRSSWVVIGMGLSLLLGACASGRGQSGRDQAVQRAQPGAELAGRTLTVETGQGQRSTLRFRRNGVVRAFFGDNELAGRWEVRDRQLCFFWPRAPRECWPYRTPFQRGRTAILTSDRGNAVRVTLR